MKAKIKYPIGGFAPGYYTNKCISCKEEFMGDKLARQCEPCAINTITESFKKSKKELNKLKSALQNFDFSCDLIKEIVKNES